VEEAWRLTHGILEAWKSQNLQNLLVYEAGTDGPQCAEDFIRRDGHRWREM